MIVVFVPESRRKLNGPTPLIRTGRMIHTPRMIFNGIGFSATAGRAAENTIATIAIINGIRSEIMRKETPFCLFGLARCNA